ncbi:MAG: response regulator [Moraxellaceae bacterium]|nr:MAG: response regulator [Moraxellaceae bacterium]
MISDLRTLLVIDHDEGVRHTIVAMLQDNGYGVHLETSSQGGLQWFIAHRPDLVLVDLTMPDIDGINLMLALREQDESVSVIVTSAVGSARDVVEALRKGATDYLIKPIQNIDFLTHAVKRALVSRDLRQENERYKRDLERANLELSDYVRILECDQQAARQVQRNLLPATPAKVAGITLEHKVIPSLYLSGDFVDYGGIQNRYVAFYLTDVSGHGASSAFVTIWLKPLVRRMFKECRSREEEVNLLRDPSLLVQYVNKELLHSHFGCHLTCFVGVFDTEDRTLSYVTAGHLPLPILVEQGRARYLTGKGKPVGIFSDNRWQVFHEQVEDGFNLVIFSDGILDTLPPDGLLEREAYLLERMQGLEGGMAGILARLDLHSERAGPDDIAILSLEQRGRL